MDIQPLQPADFIGRFKVTQVSFDDTWPGSMRLDDFVEIAPGGGGPSGLRARLVDAEGGEKLPWTAVTLARDSLMAHFPDPRLPEGLHTTIQISRVVDGPDGGAADRGLYGSVAVGDPRQVGVWGAEEDGGG